MELFDHGSIWSMLWSLVYSVHCVLAAGDESTALTSSLTSTNVDLFNVPKDDDALVTSITCHNCNEKLLEEGEKYGRDDCCVYASFSRCLISNPCQSLNRLGIEYAINYTAHLYGCNDGPVRFISFNCIILYYWIPLIITLAVFAFFGSIVSIQMILTKNTYSLARGDLS